ncbi:MAG: DUF2007 domain-containing protein [Anaerolineae bacterium]|nr:DUF2007 domain-containing protein [Anaerolineae bacterium]
MADERWEELRTVVNSIEAEILRGLLEAQGIRVYLSQEGAGRALGLSFTPMGEVTIMVPTSQMTLANEILNSYLTDSIEDHVTDKGYPTSPED